MLRCVVAANDANMSPIVNLGEHEAPWPRDDDSPHEPEVAAETDAAATQVDDAALRRVIAFGNDDDDDNDDLFGPPDAAQGTRPPSPVPAGPSAATLQPSPIPAVKHVDAPAVPATATPSKRQRLFACFRPCCAPAAEKATTCDREVTSHLCNMKQHVVRAIIALTEPLAGASVRAVDVQSRPPRTFQ
jgi:hypothetical protein